MKQIAISNPTMRQRTIVGFAVTASAAAVID